VKLRQPDHPKTVHEGDLTDEEAAALERAASPPGWRMDGPEFDWCQDAAVELLAARWRRRVERGDT
jgi:hypothetical protein